MTAANRVPAIPSNDLAAAVLQVEVVALPAYLDNTDILLRRGPHRLESVPTGHWGERLSLGLTHALAAELTDKLPRIRVVLERPESRTVRVLRVSVASFDVFPDGHCVLVAEWVIVEKAPAEASLPAPVLGGGTFVTPPLAQVPPDVAALVAAMSAAVARLADGIVATL
jgi:uncharacterized lipoprotein YmbA